MSIKVAACQLDPELGNIHANLNQAELLIERAFDLGAEWVILPEFFPAGMAFHSSMISSALPTDGPATRLLVTQARKHHGYVGGSFVRVHEGEHYNSFVLATPDGSIQIHDKDIPTWWEHCYYRGGKDNGILKTKQYAVGSILCWELIRWSTAKRLKNKIDFVVSASCWPGMPLKSWIVRRLFKRFDRIGYRLLKESPARMARILGVPLIHASHSGRFRAKLPILNAPYFAIYQSETKIVDGTGKTLARLTIQDGADVIVTEIQPGQVGEGEPIQNRILIPRFSPSVQLLWNTWFTATAVHGKRFYRRLKRDHPELFEESRASALDVLAV